VFQLKPGFVETNLGRGAATDAVNLLTVFMVVRADSTEKAVPLFSASP
jgi:hypothetical protein